MTVFDVGMYDGSDTQYYLESGYDVVAIEANPQLVGAASRKFATHIAAGRLKCVHAAVSPDGEPVELIISQRDLGSSSVLSERVEATQRGEAISVPGVTLQELFARYGVPEFLKVDIEGADRLCVLALTPESRPRFLSFEIGDDVDELLEHARSVGYRRFKVMNQCCFRELARQRVLAERIAQRVARMLGHDEPRVARRAGRVFVRGSSSGPVPWKSDGRWWSCDEVRRRVADARASGELAGAWYDIQARVD